MRPGRCGWSAGLRRRLCLGVLIPPEFHAPVDPLPHILPFATTVVITGPPRKPWWQLQRIIPLGLPLRMVFRRTRGGLNTRFV